MTMIAMYRRMLTEALRADSAHGPQQGVRDLLDALDRGDEETVLSMVDPDLRSVWRQRDPMMPALSQRH